MVTNLKFSFMLSFLRPGTLSKDEVGKAGGVNPTMAITKCTGSSAGRSAHTLGMPPDIFPAGFFPPA
jgi:hypothetical protein